MLIEVVQSHEQMIKILLFKLHENSKRIEDLGD